MRIVSELMFHFTSPTRGLCEHIIPWFSLVTTDRTQRPNFSVTTDDSVIGRVRVSNAKLADKSRIGYFGGSTLNFIQRVAIIRNCMDVKSCATIDDMRIKFLGIEIDASKFYVLESKFFKT